MLNHFISYSEAPEIDDVLVNYGLELTVAELGLQADMRRELVLDMKMAAAISELEEQDVWMADELSRLTENPAYGLVGAVSGICLKLPRTLWEHPGPQNA